MGWGTGCVSHLSNDNEDVRAAVVVAAGEAAAAGRREAGIVTSGGVSPSLGMTLICLAYVDHEHASEGTELSIIIRGKERPFVVVPLPFVPFNYRR